MDDNRLRHLRFDLPAVSGISGSISIACWIVVFSPQIIENFRRSSAEGLSVTFIFVWLIGDVFNILGGVLQGVLPTMIILAWYYTLADIVILLQCFYYRGFTLSDKSQSQNVNERREVDEQAPLLQDQAQRNSFPGSRRSSSTIQEHLTRVLSNDGTHLSPAVPVHGNRDTEALKAKSPVQTKATIIKSLLLNSAAIAVVCVAGVLGWLASIQASKSGDTRETQRHDDEDDLIFNLWGQIFGYICALLYLGSRLPQLLLNYRRKSTEGVSMLFFLFAVIGNLTYVVSILAYEPPCKQLKHGCVKGQVGEQYARNMLINLSWLIGSAGTLLLDSAVFVQWFLYKDDKSHEHAVE